jgi:hypothetical protein
MRTKKSDNTQMPMSEKPVVVKNNKTNIQVTPKTDEILKENLNLKNPDLILKSGDTDLRRGPKALNELIKITGNNPFSGDLFGFSNEKDTIKIIQQKTDGSEMLIKKMIEPIRNWPAYQPKGEPGYMVVLKGKEKDSFLDEIGCPKTL